ncbi:MAG: hypothetical protein BMS9Abin01_2767 [Gammaproteobacteria bacterium]|nr:MAG: hypothetical protein BMS9Abin01_2767 [Gammaproteobacteria bacterium]
MAEVAIVTGASRGIGAAVAKLLGANGYRVCVNYRAGREAAEGVSADIVNAGGEALAVQADVADRDAVRRLFETVDHRLGRRQPSNAARPLFPWAGLVRRRKLPRPCFGCSRSGPRSSLAPISGWPAGGPEDRSIRSVALTKCTGARRDSSPRLPWFEDRCSCFAQMRTGILNGAPGGGRIQSLSVMLVAAASEAGLSALTVTIDHLCGMIYTVNILF